MHYPADFPSESRAAVAAAKLRAGRDFDKLRGNPPDIGLGLRQDCEAELRKYILRQFIVFVREACNLGRTGVWQVDRIEKAAMEFLRLSTIEAEFGKGHGVIRGSWTSNCTGHVNATILRQFEQSDEWRQFEDALLEVAEWHAARAQPVAERGVARDSTPSEPTGDGITENELDLSKMVDDFLLRCNQASSDGVRVIRKHIWQAAGHISARQFQYWQRRNDKATDEDRRNFLRILRMPPPDFIALVKRRKDISVSRR